MRAQLWSAHWRRGNAAVAERFDALRPASVTPLLRVLDWDGGELQDYGSLENRVYGFGRRDGQRAVLKLHRPARWGAAGIAEEVAFAAELVAAGLPVVRDLPLPGGEPVGEWEGIHYRVLAHVAGEPCAPREVAPAQMRALGALAAGIHEVGAHRGCEHRITLEAGAMGGENLALFEASGLLPERHAANYGALVREALALAESAFEGAELLRVHGDLSVLNMVWTEAGPVVIDLDDFLIAPPVQDLVPLYAGVIRDGVNGSRDLALGRQLRAEAAEGYRGVRPLDPRWELQAELLHVLREVWADAWSASRWVDAAFREGRADWQTPSYWERRLRRFEAQRDWLRAAV